MVVMVDRDTYSRIGLGKVNEMIFLRKSVSAVWCGKTYEQVVGSIFQMEQQYREFLQNHHENHSP